MNNIKIKDVAIFHPQNSVDNDYYTEHFDKQGKDVRGLLKAMGRERRYINDDPNETPLTMGIKAVNAVLEKTKLTAKDLDMIIFTSQTPETTLPSNAIRLFDAIKPKAETIVYDLNANCAGMTVALEQVSHYMKSNTSLQYALIVGADYWSLISDPEDPLCYTCFADGAAAMIIERTTEDVGFIDSTYHVNTVFAEKMMFPAEGLTKGIRETGDLKYARTIPFDGGIVLDATYGMLETLFKRNNVNPSEVKYCFSQFALSNIKKIKEHFSLTDEQVVYVGDEFGYTGTSSPFIALHEGVKSGQIKRNDYVIFWTIGAGFELVATLIKY
ncbi:3-oxoacyl-[acyl-carrier-protein] synthase III C-terminal domain-containing protein [Rummeliibacillus stabekisii]|uniref:3-oxoacyl-ACP synthase n=1 Tax=Rummeliibacillus stabekisii TaxID=241244 RepID=A0A143HDS3_9BACL|nr:3-oxoacyl-[acyl-carrier-protein] synthase III C-terminal domain-containing protein [Rummeliibacillus stabekisii]AMW99579.1 3-oxoacyl-ACP synthase [Rummeliibacillus stabekisii]